ncbi:Monooxygenase, FAD-binding [Penicillium expansum]|nr:Monooxygenase, FAD-binding [Penicillium expansum]
MQPNPKFRVIIVGGSVAGLTLAHCLLKNNIDFVVLEASPEVAPEVGASLGLLANGGRILDQLGVYDDVQAEVVSIEDAYFWAADGSLMLKSNSPDELNKQHGYPIAFLPRRMLLKILLKHLGDRQDDVVPNKKVIRVDHYPSHVIVHCADGSSFEGDMVVGADGVRSVVRQSMWDYMESQGLKSEVQKERSTMSAEYNCVFGMSTATPGLDPKDIHRTFGKDWSFLTIAGKGNKSYWFLYNKMDRIYYGSDIPRFNKADIDEHVAPYLHRPVTDSVPFSELYKRSTIRTFVALEEANFNHWCIDRFACIGDSIHKMTPNIGQGGNSAIESSATLANHLARLLQRSSPCQTEDINRCTQAWQASRRDRVDKICREAFNLTRLEAIASPKYRLMIYLIPYMKTKMIEKTSATLVVSPKLECAPETVKALWCSIPYKTEKPASVATETIWERVLWGMPFLGCFAVASATMGAILTKVRPLMIPYFIQGTWSSTNGEVLDIRKAVYHIPFLDNLLRPMITCFLPSISGSDLQSRAQMISFLADLGAVYGIWLLESYRKANGWSEVAIPISICSVFQLKGIGLLAPIYYLLEYVRAPLSNLLPKNMREVEPTGSISLLAAMLIGHYFPTFASFTAPTLDSRRWWNAMWQIFPITVPLIQLPFALLGKPLLPSTKASPEEKSQNSITSTRIAYGGFALISALTFIYARRSAPADASLLSIFWPGFGGHHLPVTSFQEGIARFLQYDQVLSMGSGFFWLALRFREIKKSGGSVSWWKAIGSLVATISLFGPGTAFALGWGWREELIHKLAISQGVYPE